MNRLTTSDQGLDLIRQFEGYSSLAYPDPGTGGKPYTIGYGTTVADGKPVYSGQTCTAEQAKAWLRYDVASTGYDVWHLLKVPVTQNQFDALVSFVYNVGSHAFAKSTLLRKLNASDYAGAAEEFLRWDKAGGQPLRGLTRRRRAERELFLKEEVNDALVSG